MAPKGPINLKVSAAKKPIKRLPTSLEITPKTTVQDVKDQLAKAAGISDPNRLGISNPQTKKILANRLALVSEIEDVLAAKEILVKDLGPQISWQLVFVIEYAGPIFIHLAFAALRPYLYSNVKPLSASQLLSLGMIVLHFIKREYETLFVHRFSLATMPVRNIFKNCLHYWLLSGLYVAYFIYKPTSYTALSGPTINLINIVGLAIYAFGELSNLYTHRVLSNLRSPGGTERGIPHGFGFGLVTCPNYMFETLAWVGMVLVSKSLSTAIFSAIGLLQMQQWAVGKEKKYRAEFGDKYKKKRYPVIPSPGAVIKALTS